MSTPPEVRTCVVTTSWNEYKQVWIQGKSVIQNAVSVVKGEEGFILGGPSIDYEQGQQWRPFRRARGERWADVGWVLEKNLVIGQVAAKVKVVRKESLTVSQSSNPIQRGNTILEKTVRLLFSEFEANRRLLLSQGMAAFLLNFIKNSDDKLVDLFLKGIPRTVLHVIEHGNFTFEHLRSMPDDPAYILGRNSPDRIVIYALLFEDVNGEDGVYIGKTINAGRRMTNHVYGLQNPNTPGQMYRVGRQARNQIFIQLLELKDVPPKQVDPILQIFEHLFVCLFQSWVKVLLRDSDTLEQTEKYFGDSIAATIFSGITDRVCAITGWKPLCLTALGLNWKTPLFESRISRSIWTVRTISPTIEEGLVRVYTTQPRQVHVNNQGYNKVAVLKGKGLDELCWKGAPFPGTMVSVIVEISAEGKHHPVPFARVPEPGPFSDWEDLNRIGIRIEWMDNDGQWYSEWRQARRIWSMKKYPQDAVDRFSPVAAKAYPHLFQLYGQLRRFYDSLRYVVYDETEELLPWLKCGSPIIIKELVYDHLSQTITIQNQIPISRSPPTLVSFEDNTILLDELYRVHCTDGVLIIGDRPKYGLHERDKTTGVKSCAVCHEVEYPFGRQGQECPNMPGIPEDHPTEEAREASCRRCFDLRRPCAHVRIKDLYEARGLKYLREFPPLKNGPEPIEVPSWCQDMGPSNDEIEEETVQGGGMEGHDDEAGGDGIGGGIDEGVEV